MLHWISRNSGSRRTRGSRDRRFFLPQRPNAEELSNGSRNNTRRQRGDPANIEIETLISGLLTFAAFAVVTTAIFTRDVTTVRRS